MILVFSQKNHIFTKTIYIVTLVTYYLFNIYKKKNTARKSFKDSKEFTNFGNLLKVLKTNELLVSAVTKETKTAPKKPRSACGESIKK